MINRKMRLFAFALCAVLVLWFGGWFVFALWARGAIDRSLDEFARQGANVSCAPLDIIGFPFRAGIRCNEVSAEFPPQAARLNLAHMRVLAPIYALHRIRAEASAPLNIETAMGAFQADWTHLRAYLELGETGFDLFSMRGESLLLGELGGIGLGFKKASLHLRPDPVEKIHLDTAFQFENLVIGARDFLGDFLDGPSGVNLEADIQIRNLYRRIFERDAPLRADAAPFETHIRSMVIGFTGNRGEILLSGDLRLETDGSVSGKIIIGLEDAAELARLASALNPRLADVSANLFQALELVGAPRTIAGRTVPTVSVDIDRGTARIGFITLGRLPSFAVSP